MIHNLEQINSGGEIILEADNFRGTNDTNDINEKKFEFLLKLKGISKCCLKNW